MDQQELEALKYPIGRYQRQQAVHATQIEQWIGEIEVFPNQLRKVLKSLPEEGVKWRYRPGGWTIQQVVHHCADSHMNSFIRFKLCLTEDTPTIKPYHEALWAELPDANSVPIMSSLSILEGLHSRWFRLLESLSGADIDKGVRHPEYSGVMTLRDLIGLYAWHGKHHLAHIVNAVQRQSF